MGLTKETLLALAETYPPANAVEEAVATFKNLIATARNQIPGAVNVTVSDEEVKSVIRDLVPLLIERYKERDIEYIAKLLLPYAAATIVKAKSLIKGKSLAGVWGSGDVLVIRLNEPKLFGKTSWEVSIGTADAWTDYLGTSTATYKFDTKEAGFGACSILGIYVRSTFVPAYVHASTWKKIRDRFLLYLSPLRPSEYGKVIKFPYADNVLDEATFGENEELYIRVKDPAVTGTAELELLGFTVATTGWVASKVGL